MKRRNVMVLVLVLFVLYAVPALHYYAGQLHPFDPYTQMPLARIPEPLQVRQPREIRILALGGSTTEERGLPEDSRYPRVVQDILSATYPDLRIVVFNAGRDWLTSKHSLIAYTTYYQDWDPDIVIMLDGMNDLYQSFSPMRFSLGGPYDPLYSHFYGAASDALRPPSFEQHLYMRFAQAGAFTIERWYEKPFLRHFEASYPLERYHSLAAFQGNLTKLIASLRSNGAEPVLVTQASLYKPAMSAAEQQSLWFGRVFMSTRMEFARYEYPDAESLRMALAAFNDAMRTLAQDKGVTLVDGDAAVPKSLTMFEDDCHYTVEGARMLAEAVAREIISADLIPAAAARNGVSGLQ